MVPCHTDFKWLRGPVLSGRCLSFARATFLLTCLPLSILVVPKSHLLGWDHGPSCFQWMKAVYKMPHMPTEKAMAPPLQYSCLGNAMDGGAW